MRTCDACGFENAEPGKPCALCGASEIVHGGRDLPAPRGLEQDLTARQEAASKTLTDRLARWLGRRE